MAGIDKAKERYERWWAGKLCRVRYCQAEYKRVASVNVYGPPSFVYGCAELVFEDGTTRMVSTQKFRPGRAEVEVAPPERGAGEHISQQPHGASPAGNS